MGLGAMAMAAATPVARPYVADEYTLHLWHLDEPAPPLKDEGPRPTPLLGLINGVQAGVPAMTGFGSAVRLSHAPPRIEDGIHWPYGPILLAKPALSEGPADNVDPPFPIAGADGAFTIEALIKLDVLPPDAPGLALDIVSMDDDESDNRVFIFRIEKPGFLTFLPLSGETVLGGSSATIPTSGPHAMKVGEWFHVAVAYNGREGEDDNLRLYWTRVDAGSEGAHLIGTGTLITDLRHQLGDFAIGNSGKAAYLFGPWEFFPGMIDEVRISDMARPPYDFCFVSEEARDQQSSLQAGAAIPEMDLSMKLRQILVSGTPVAIPAPGEPLVLPAGLHRLDFDFGFLPDLRAAPLSVRCRMEGLEEDWRPSARGMTMEWEMLDERSNVLARRVFTATGASRGWEGDPVKSRTTRRQEAIFIPQNSRRVRVSISSGPPDTTGSWVIEGIALRRPSSFPAVNLWEDSDLNYGERMAQIGGIPIFWQRTGTDPSMARVMQLSPHRALALLDARKDHSAGWVSVRDLPVQPDSGGETFILSWSESYGIVPGPSQRASYANVPPGSYTFRAIALGNEEEPQSIQLALPIVIRPPYWKRAWFIPLAAALGVLSIGLLLFAGYRQRAQRRLAALRLQHVVERDRARIARDMHDDLGTRVTVLNLAAALVRRAMDGDPEKARRRLLRMETAARDLVQAMQGLVWAVNPANDTLDHLANHLAASAQDIFRDSPVKLRIDIAVDLPPLPLGAEFRHHFALAVKESLHNVLKHAGPCEATFRLALEEGQLVAGIVDTGCGFDPSQSREGNGLANLQVRLAELGGSAAVESRPGEGTRVTFRCKLIQAPANPDS